MALILLLLIALLPLPARAALSPAITAQLAFQQHPGRALPLDAPLVDAAGRRVTLGDAFGTQPAILVLEYFHCPNLCGLTMEGLFSSLARSSLIPGRDYRLIAISIDPTETTADAAAAKQQGLTRTPHRAQAETAWNFFTGDEKSVRRIAEAVGFPYRFDPAIGQIAHPAGITLVTPHGVVSRYLLGILYKPEALRDGLADAGHGVVAGWAAPLLLLCYHYDPATGRYSLAVYRIVQIGGATMLLALGLGFFMLKRRERP